ncbi:MAG: hypothetical protein ABIE23_06145 [archaeon]
MWFIITLIAAVAVTATCFLVKNKKYKLGFLALMLWGAFIMVLVDHVLGFLSEGGGFIEFTTDGLISSGAMLGIAMRIPIAAIWVLVVYTPLGNKICIE